MKKLVLSLFSIFLISCSTSVPAVMGEIIRQPENIPAAFVPEDGVTLNRNSCKSPMIDPRDGTEVRFIRSEGGVGDYEVPEGKYGINRNELLRLYCENGEVAGVVKK
ncbi:hypothetical protein [Salegentibacter sediminis]|uniref:hypothetical protein n=1 Tax=Salegentibacter sediminis TaxID=1930251 RepID=UPI0012FF9882|nr:hypothetical protein [Salegentibacter sediminis]